MIKNIFNKLFKKEESKHFKVEVSFSTSNKEYKKKEYPKKLLKRNLKEIGIIENICPYCKDNIEKRPTRKKKCSSCSKFIFVRTRPIDRKNILIKEEEKELIEKEWTQYYLNKEDINLSEDKLYVKTKERLRKQFGFEPNISDVKWSYYEHQKMEFMKLANWSGFRNIILSQAQQLKKEKKLKQSLNLYLEIMWYDLTGAQKYNSEYPELSPEFSKMMIFVAPGIVSEILILKKKLNYTNIEIKKCYDDYVTKACNNPRAPIGHKKVWSGIEKELNKI